MIAEFIGLMLVCASHDNNVEWNGVSHVTWLDRRPLCPVNGEAFTVYFQAYINDLTDAKVHVTNNGVDSEVDAVYDHDRGPYAVWRASIPAMTGTTLSYWIELIDGVTSAYLSASGMSWSVPVDGGFQLNKTTLTHAPLGATPVTGGTVFKVWAPNATQAFIRGDFNGWGTGNPMTKQGQDFIAFVAGAHAGQQYKYNFNPGDLWRPDPRARQFKTSDGSYNSIIVDPLAFTWHDGNYHPPYFEDLIIYELHVGTFSGLNDPVASGSNPGTYRDVAAHVGHLVQLGVTAVELMPINEFPTSMSVGYNPVSMFAPESGLGSPADFKYMVDTLHANGIAVLLDIVWNHISPSDNFLWNFDSGSAQSYFHTPDVQTPWGSQADFGRGEVRQYYVDSAIHWTDEYHIDGFRFDGTDFMNRYPQEAEGWSLMQWFNNTLDNRAVDKISIAEQLPNDFYVTKPTSEGGAGFDSQWHDPWVDNLRNAIGDAAFGDPSMGSIQSAVNGDGSYLYGTYLTRYFELHDELMPSTGGSRAVNWIDTTWPHDDIWAKGRTKLAQGLTLLVPGIPALFMGSEWLEDTNLCGGDANGACRIDWAKKTTYANIFKFYQDAVALRKAYGCFRSNAGWQVTHVNDGGNVLAFQRWDNSGNVCLVVANFSNNNFYGYRLGFPQAGAWQTALNSQSAFYDGNNVGNTAITTEGTAWDGFAQSALVDLPQMGLVVFKWGMPPPPPCPGDLDGNRQVDLSDLAILLGDYGCTTGTCIGDLNDDGFTDLGDLAAMLSAYGLVCP